MTWTALLSLLDAHILGMVLPGPDLFLILRLATKSRKHTIAVVADTSTGAAIQITLIVFGFTAVITTNPLPMGVIQLVGGCYLIYMSISMAKAGINILCEPRAGATPALGSGALRSLRAAFHQGFLTNMSNPKTTLFLAAVLSQFIPAGISVGTLVLCTLVLIVSQVAFFLFIAIVVSTDAVVKQMVLAGPRIDTVAGAIFLVLSMPLIVSGAGTVF